MPRNPKIESLQAVLDTLPMPEGQRKVASKWRCRRVPYCEDVDDMLHFFDSSIPVLVPRERGKLVHEECGGDAMDFVTDPRWNSFPKPKIAFRAGWAGPGTVMEQEEYHTLITSFSDMGNDGEKKQSEGASATQKEGAAPAPASTEVEVVDEEGNKVERPEPGEENLQKPKENILNLQFFHRVDKESHPPIPNLSELLLWPEVLDDGATCDNATRVSQRGAVTWWHLDDSGEFVMQTGLPDKAHPEGNYPVKVFLYGPRDSYDWFMHDEESDRSGKIAALDIFNATDDELPPAEELPIITIAVLEAGGRPLISPPNIPHIVITVNQCVMVEQRRISNLFLDEVGYFMQRLQHWKQNPIVYEYVRQNLQEDGEFVHNVVGTLVRAHNENYNSVVKRRAASSLYAIAAFPKVFNLENDARESLKSLLKSPEFQATLTADVVDGLVKHFDVQRMWPIPGEVFFLRDSTQFCGVVYKNSSPVYGPLRPNYTIASQDRTRMLQQMEAGTLGEKLEARQQKRDEELLDELF